MLCSDTSSKLPAVKIDIPVDVVEYISNWLKSIKVKPFSGNADLTLHARGGNIEEYSTNIKERRARKKTA